ncbi:FK-506 binding protein 1A-like protein [Leptotrombidium deliense]|uniref:FK-506 binding protein 1A-like protein n=1 Tax=Leptotrombidium deliense TaxID=299467 RepID=A0A443RTU3_9ACAR|nr:FK-506 binding protein 1A-like protein [Leptotrombidium deliense]
MALIIETVKPGDGKTFPTSGQTVPILFVGKLPNGTELLSSGKYKISFKIQLGKKIDVFIM